MHNRSPAQALHRTLLPPLVQLSRLCSLAIVLALFAYLAGRFNTRELPDSAAVVPDLLSEPIQEPLDHEPFDFSYRGETYIIEPVASYELRGLVVTHNDINAFSDIYHSEDSVDVKDICVIWGDNLKDNNFHQMRYWSEPWTCNFQAPTREILAEFDDNQLSNSHLLAASEHVRQAISSVEIGDQISLRGMLVNYAPKGRPEFERKSSTIRSDTGNGACEVIFVEEFSTLKEYNADWRRLRVGAARFLLFFVLVKILLWFVIPQIEFRSR